MISQYFLTLFLTVISSSVLLFLIKQKRKRVQARKLPPGPKKMPFIGNLHQMTGDSPHTSLQQLSNDYGPLMFLQLGSVPTLVVSSADVARDIFRTHDLIFSGRPELYATNILLYDSYNITFAPYGDCWREIKKIAIMELFSPKRVQSFQAVRSEEVALMIDFIARSPQPIDLSKLIFLLANNIICRVIFGQKFDSGDSGRSRFDELMREIQASVGTSSIADFIPWMGWLNKFNGREASVQKSFRELNRFYDEEILQQHLDPKRPRPEHEDLVDVLLGIQKDPGRVFSPSNEQIKGLLTDMFVAGTDTSSATMVWTMTELIRNPTVMRRAQNEVREIVKGKEKVEERDLSKLMYIKLILKEALRLHPPAPLLVPRETTEDCMLGEYTISAKTRVFINAKAIATDPRYWENPYEFQPERFLNSSIDFKGQNFELIPFGVGRRGCPAINFVTPILELALANLLYRFDWKLPHGMRNEDMDMEEAPGITVHKKNPLFLVAIPTNL